MTLTGTGEEGALGDPNLPPGDRRACSLTQVFQMFTRPVACGAQRVGNELAEDNAEFFGCTVTVLTVDGQVIGDSSFDRL